MAWQNNRFCPGSVLYRRWYVPVNRNNTLIVQTRYNINRIKIKNKNIKQYKFACNLCTFRLLFFLKHSK